jgi:hypothetical protein
VRCSDATTSSFVVKVHGEVFVHFHAVDVKSHSSMWNYGIMAVHGFSIYTMQFGSRQLMTDYTVASIQQ